MKKISFGAILILAFIFILQITINTTHAQSATYPIRNLTLDTLGKTVRLQEDSSNRDGKLYELSNGAIMRNWKVKYEQKGSMRMMCEPPVLNISFDKYDSKGRPKQLFDGVSTYQNYDQLQYQKIRLIPECDGWNDYNRDSWGMIGFDGQLNVTLREYIIYKIFRAFNIPTADVIGFANVTFVTPDSGYEGKTFRYMIVQRPSEQDDQIPFTTQYNLDPHLYESGDYESGERPWNLSNYDKIISATLHDIKNDEEILLNFDIKTSLRFSLLTDFLSVNDMYALHNEDWGVDLQTGLVKVIPHGFDASFNGCEFTEPENAEFASLFRNLPNSLRPEYNNMLYEVSRELFNNQSSLEKMLYLVDEFPYNDTNKHLLKKYIKTKYYLYSKYFNSREFYDLIGKEYQNQDLFLPFSSDEEYGKSKEEFMRLCNVGEEPAEYTFSITSKPKFQKNPINDNEVSFSVDAEIYTKDESLELLKPNYGGGPFIAKLVGEYKDNSSDIRVYYQIQNFEKVEDSVGPYYIIPPHTSIKLKITQSFDVNSKLKDKYFFELVDFKANYRFKAEEINLKSDSLSFGNIEPIVILSPSENEIIDTGKFYQITWKGSPNKPVYLSLIDERTDQKWSISNPNTAIVFEDNKFEWMAGNIYYWDTVSEKFIKANVDPGRYRIQITDNLSWLMFKSEPFTLTDSNQITSPKIEIVGNPKLSMQYNNKGDETILISSFDVKIDSGDREIRLFTNNSFSSYVQDQNRSRTYRDSINVFRIDNGENNADYYTIKAGESAVFRILSSFNPAIMFSGMYSALLDGIWLDSQFGQKEYKITNNNQSNKLVIIGEKSPYINSAFPNKSPSNNLLTIEGVRFAIDMPNWITLDDPYSDCPKGFTCPKHRRYEVISSDGKSIKFIPNIDPGIFILQVTHPETGQSNKIWIEISEPTIPTEPSVTPNKEKINSGESVTLNYIVPKGTVSTSLMLYCPDSVKAIDERSKNICNKSVSLGQNPSHTTFTLSSTASWPQYVVPNFYIYYENDPNFAVGVSSQITVLPATLSTTTATSTDASATSTGLIGRIIDSAQGILTSTIRTITSVIRPSPSPIPVTTATPVPSPSTTPRISPSISPNPSSSVTPSPRPSTSVSPTPAASTTVSPKPSPSISPKMSPTPSIRPSVTPSPTSTPSPSSTPVPTASPTPSSTPSATPTPTPIITPTPVSTPNSIATPTPTPTSTPSQSPSSNPSSTYSTTPSPSPTATPAPSNSTAPSPSPTPFVYSRKTGTANTFEAYMRMIGIIR